MIWKTWKKPDKQYRICSMSKTTCHWIDEYEYRDRLDSIFSRANQLAMRSRYRIYQVHDKGGVIATYDGDIDIGFDEAKYRECYL